jgi:hypothetical protein
VWSGEKMSEQTPYDSGHFALTMALGVCIILVIFSFGMCNFHDGRYVGHMEMHSEKHLAEEHP